MVRIKYRYIVFEVIFPSKKSHDEKLRHFDVTSAIKLAILQAHGDFGLGILMNSLQVRYISKWNDVILVRSRRGAHKLLQTSVIMFLKKIKRFDVSCRTLHIGGTIKACEKFLIQYYRSQLTSLMSKCSTQYKMKQIQEVIVSTCKDLNVDSSNQYI